MRCSFVFSLLLCSATTLHAQHQYRCWFDNQTDQVQTGTVEKSAHLDLDVTSLADGVHQLYVAVTDADGASISQQSRIFVKTPTGKPVRYHCWFDNDPSKTVEGVLDNYEGITLDVSHLSVGIHNLRVALTDLGGNVAGQLSSLFVKTPTGGIVRYEYYVNDWQTLVGSQTLSSPEAPYHLLADLDVSGVAARPLDSRHFYFSVEDGQPVVMSKNDLFFRFYSQDYSYVEGATEYADANTSEPVVAQALTPKVSLLSAVPEEHQLSWFKADVEAGDSVLFTVDAPSTMRLYAPDGAELTTTDSCEIRMRAGDGGTFYLAVHDASATVSWMNVYFETVEKDTKIGGIAQAGSTDKHIYNLNGQRVTPTHKGIYIVNRRKQQVKASHQ